MRQPHVPRLCGEPLEGAIKWSSLICVSYVRSTHIAQQSSPDAVCNVPVQHFMARFDQVDQKHPRLE
jgi:hypothetical protein